VSVTGASDDRPTVDRLAERLRDAALASGRTVAVAESLTGGGLSAAIARAPDSSTWFRGGVVAYASEVKHGLLGVPEGPVVSEIAVRAMAAAVGRLLEADTTVAVSGVGGPDEQDGQPPGTVWLALGDRGTVLARLEHLAGEPDEIVAETCRIALAWLVERAEA
jgi:nicotinamide-nucleotide amidase